MSDRCLYPLVYVRAYQNRQRDTSSKDHERVQEAVGHEAHQQADDLQHESKHTQEHIMHPSVTGYSKANERENERERTRETYSSERDDVCGQLVGQALALVVNHRIS